MTRIAIVQLPMVSILAVPGYHLAHHLRAGPQGCSYDWSDLGPLARLARAAPAPRLLLAHGPPRGRGAAAIDRAFGEVNIGDPLLSRLLAQGRLAFGLFGHVAEAAGRATTVDGQAVAPGRPSDTLLMQVGAADALPYQTLAGSWLAGAAAIVEVRRGKASYQPLIWPAASPVASGSPDGRVQPSGR